MTLRPLKTIENTLKFILGGVLLLTSCTDSKKVAYFNGVQDSILKTAISASEPIIQKNDLLSIVVTSLNPDANMIFNSANESSHIAGETTITAGYLVNSDGNIQYPILGSIHVAGLTKKQLTAYFLQQLVDKKLLIDPVVTIRFLNFRVTVLGEVARPGLITVPNEKVTILEALGLAGDLTIYAKRDNLLLIREQENGDKMIKRIDLSSSDILSSSYYYLKSNDVIYVEPNANKIASVSRSVQLMPIILSGISLLVVVLYQVNK